MGRHASLEPLLSAVSAHFDWSDMSNRDLIVEFIVPFCLKKCSFCTRKVFEGWDSTRSHQYILAVQKELLANAEEFNDHVVRAIHWGGGIASMTNAQDISDTMTLIKKHYHVAEDAPMTMRAIISNISAATMPFYKRAKVTRFDFEMMSLDLGEFTTVNNHDNFDEFNIVCDYFLRPRTNDLLGIVLLVGHKGVSAASFRKSIVEFKRLPASHLILQLCEGEDAVNDEEMEQQLALARELLSEEGFIEYVSLNFAKQGKEDLFTLLRSNEYDALSFGLGACTHIDGTYSKNTDDLATYLTYSHDYIQITSDAWHAGE